MKKLNVVCCAPGAAPLSEQAREALADRFKALSDPSRVAIVNRLAGAEEVCVCVFVNELGLSQPTVSHHLKVLRDAGLVGSERQGLWAYYYVNHDALEELSAWLRN